MQVKEKENHIQFIGIICVLLVYDDRRPVRGSIVTANYITVTTDSKTSINRGKGQNMLFVEVHNKILMLPSEEPMLLTASVL